MAKSYGLIRFTGPEFWQTVSGPDNQPYPSESEEPTVYYARKLESVSFPKLLGKVNLQIEAATNKNGDYYYDYIYNMCTSNYIEESAVMMVWLDDQGNRYTVDPATTVEVNKLLIAVHRQQQTTQGFGNISALNAETGEVVWTIYLENKRPSSCVVKGGNIYVAYDYLLNLNVGDNRNGSFTPEEYKQGDPVGGAVKLDLKGNIIWEYEESEGNYIDRDQNDYYYLHTTSIGTYSDKIVFAPGFTDGLNFATILDNEGNLVNRHSFFKNNENVSGHGVSFKDIKVQLDGTLLCAGAGRSFNSVAFVSSPNGNSTIINEVASAITKDLSILYHDFSGSYEYYCYETSTEYPGHNDSTSATSSYWGNLDENHQLVSTAHLCQQFPESFELTSSFSVQTWDSSRQFWRVFSSTKSEFVLPSFAKYVSEYYSFPHSSQFVRSLAGYAVIAVNKFGQGASYGINAAVTENEDVLGIYSCLTADLSENVYYSKQGKNHVFIRKHDEKGEFVWQSNFTSPIHHMSHSDGEIS